MATQQLSTGPQPKARGRKPPKPKPDHCLNCGMAATGNFCAHCG